MARFILTAIVGVTPLAVVGAPADCAAAARTVRREVAARPERVLVIVEDTLVVNDSCACEVVQAAITAAAGSPKLIGQIVFVAITAAPAHAARIAECATTTRPDAAADIDAAVEKALGPDAARRLKPAPTPAPETETTTTPTVDPKNPTPATKNPTPSEPPDFGLSPVAIGGVYLVYPGSGGSPQLVRDDDGRLYYISPGGRRLPLDGPPPHVQRPRRPPHTIIVIRPPTPTTSDAIPEDQPIDPVPPIPPPAASPPAPTP